MVQLLKELGDENLMGNLFIDLLQAFIKLRREQLANEITTEGVPMLSFESNERYHSLYD